VPRAPGIGWSAVGRKLKERRNLPLWLILILLLASAGAGSATTNFLNMQQVVVNMLGVRAGIARPSNFPNDPTLTAPTSTPIEVTGCTSSPVTATSGPNTIVLSAKGLTGTCAALNFAVKFTFTSANTLTAGSNTFTIYSEFIDAFNNHFGPLANFITLTIPSPAPAGPITVEVYVDYGSPLAPSSIIDISIIVSGT